MNRRKQLTCVWCVIVSIVTLFIGFFLVSGYGLPQHANDFALQIATFYREHTTRIGLGLGSCRGSVTLPSSGTATYVVGGSKMWITNARG